MQIEDFEYLLAIAEHANLGLAAEALGMSQPALTKAVHRIEKLSGLPLFERAARGMVLTEAGDAFLRRGRQIWLQYSDALREMQHMRGGQLGRLRVGFSPSIKQTLVMGAVRQLVDERPAAQLLLRERLASELVALLLAGELDLVLAPATEATRRDNLEFLPLYEDQFRVVADADNPLRQRRSLSLADIAREPWVLPGKGVYVRLWIDQRFAQQGVEEPNVRVEADFGHVSMWPLVHGSPLLTICNDDDLAHARRRGLDTLRVPDLDMDRKIGVLTRTGAWRSPLAQRFTQLLEAKA